MASRISLHWYVTCLLVLCSACSSDSDPRLHRLLVDGEERSYLVSLPPVHAASGALPVVLVYHGGLGNAESMERQSRMNEVAAQKGFIVVYPNGTGQPRFSNRRTWNAGSCCGYSARQQVDDVAFTRALLQTLGEKYEIDPDRVYATGMSNGAMFAYRLACELPDQIVAIAPVSGTLNLPQCSPGRGVAVLHVHGTADENVPEAGGMGKRSIAGVSYTSVEDSLAVMRKLNQCEEQAEVDTSLEPLVLSRYQCRVQVVQYLQIVGGGHDWALGEGQTRQLDLSRRILDFFDAQARQQTMTSMQYDGRSL